MLHLIQVGAGSGGMPVLDMVCRDPLVTRVTLIEPDVYKPHNVERHLFPPSAVGRLKAELARQWLLERRPELQIDLIVGDLLDPALAPRIEEAARSADIGVCAADNEPAKYHWDALMRRFAKPWTLGEVLAGGIGGFVHRFVPGGPCYGCVASFLQRSVEVDSARAPDYSQPGGPAPEVTIPASKAAIGVVAALHAQITLKLAAACGAGAANPQAATPQAATPQAATPQAADFTSLLFTLQQVPGIFEEAYKPYVFRVVRLAECLICRADPSGAAPEPQDLDAALDQALARLGNA
jgi:molybdopterin/thiamine biosynthesis adenylyltransferase